MAARPMWQGHLRLSLVSCPVAMYSAIQRTGDVHFNMLHKTTHNRIRMVPTDPETGPVERDDIVKGYELEKDHYVVVTQDEIDNVRLESTRTIDIDRFVDQADIDRLYWDEPHYLVPDGKPAAEAFVVIREAMRKAGRIALGKVVMHQRERLLALEPYEDGMIAWTLRAHAELRQPQDFFDDIPSLKADPKMVEIATRIIEQQEGPFDPSQFVDRYEEALKALIRAKEKGAGRQVTAEEPKDTNVVDLMEALRRSLGKPGAKSKAAAHTKPAARKSSAKKAPARKKAS
ncbi:Ku protein [Caulobacter sp. KR2-114]|uniref:non-homologous end joining protein Ku n=1 Tax=Caulobacter sp. KR2-114 TaxID=3400912 RepID=UPI003C09D43E